MEAGGYAAVAGLGAVIGLIAGSLGVGGGFLLVPLLSGLIGLPVEAAVASVSSFLLGPTTTALRARRVRPAELRLPVTVAGGLFVGVLAGARLLEAARGIETVRVGTLTAVDALVFGVDAALFTALAAWQVAAADDPDDEPPGLPAIGPTATFPGVPGPLPVAPLCWAAAAVGVAAGLLGIAGGVIVLPALVRGLGMSVRAASTASLAVVWIASAQATVVHAAAGRVDLGVVAALLATGPVTAVVGSRFAAKLPDRVLAHGLTGLLVFMAVFSFGRLLIGMTAAAS